MKNYGNLQELRRILVIFHRIGVHRNLRMILCVLGPILFRTWRRVKITTSRQSVYFSTKGMSYPKLHNFNEMYTPKEAVDIICKYLPKGKVYWEACYWLWHFADWLRQNWYIVVGHRDIDCLIQEPEDFGLWWWDIFITNPPFNGNKKFVRRAIELWKPFVFLIRLEHLGWVEASELLWWLDDLTVIIPKKRVNYIKPRMMQWEKVWWSPFHSVFLTHGLGLWRQIIYDNT
jgi:hypothetical protein